VSRALLSVDPALICQANGALNVAARSVHVWAFNLEATASCLDQCRQSLCRSEVARADRFVHAGSRADFIVAHGILRQLLARYTGIPACDLALSLGPNGKPTLDAESGHGKVSFNLTHSHGRALIAVSDGREVGIDLERINPNVKALAIARRYFASAELSAIEGAPTSLQAHVFFRYWVAKEALLKGQGMGLRFPIDAFEVQFESGAARARIRNRSPSKLAADWRVQMLPVEADWAAALAVRGKDWTLRLQNPHPARKRNA
jgi:4'-phosphopantetheinyl transferase